MSTVILRTAAKLLVAMGLALAVFIYWKGHQMPGGGFVAGLVASVALVVHRMSEGPADLRRLLPCRERFLVGLGLLLALGTGVGSLVFGLPFMSSAHGYLPLGGGKTTEWATAMVFDLGVFFVVTGVVVGMIDALSWETER